MDAGLCDNCSSLVSVTLPSTVTEIGVYEFYNCTSLTTVNVDWSKITSIGRYAFYNCSKWNESIVINATCDWDSETSFYGCSLLDYSFGVDE